MATLAPDQIESRLAGTAWALTDREIAREQTFADFAAALAALNRVAAVAEAANHHPDLLLHGWNRLRVTLSTHSEGGVTERDLELAPLIDDAFAIS